MNRHAGGLSAAWLVVALAMPGCVSMRINAPSPDLRPCTDGYAYTQDGWRLGVRHYRPDHPDPNKLPVILCHGMGLNATFWTLTDDHLPAQLTHHGYEVYVFDIRASGENGKPGRQDRINRILRGTPFRESGESNWSIDEMVRFDIPAVLDYVERDSGRQQVNWIGHSLGGMVAYPFLELNERPERFANFVGMGSTIIQANVPQTKMLRANAAIRGLLRVASPGRLGRPLMYHRLPGMEGIDRFYYSAENVDPRTISRYYAYTLEDPGPGLLAQFEPYLRDGHLLSSDGRIDYAARLGQIRTPTLMVAGAADLISDVPSTRLTFEALGSADKTMYVFGKANGHVADYAHCDLAWSRHAPHEIFPVLIEWLDRHQPGASSALPGTALSLSTSRSGETRQIPRSVSAHPGPQVGVDADP
ncbi:alpha/beta fold hydrolase [Aquisphaera insulae]|uniref:alpha/beta fold hydrolase n=1 Tax=Aquisphaera insulae TaxID=2712864 RepID=UPI0013ED1F0B|nr:alpha/beta fold hydrolase [Aquisphaera insulae]